MKATLGTADCREIEKMIDAGNEEARLLYEAQAYQIAKGIGEMAPVLCGDIDYIILTGGMVYSEMMTKMVTDRVKFIAPVIAVPDAAADSERILSAANVMTRTLGFVNAPSLMQLVIGDCAARLGSKLGGRGGTTTSFPSTLAA
ncbi:MAG: hypothetical protein Pg6C_08010 [Treponemataceae bacterium]|nr:MAG: hypothetical protein Pg6C_08010 [Treponemataceae bacterium]